MDTVMKMLGQRIKQMRENKGYSQVALARKVGVDRALFNKYERAGVQPSNETLVLLATNLETSVDFLLGYSDDPTPPNREVLSSFSDIDLKFALFGDSDIDNETVEEVKQFALFVKHRNEIQKKKNEKTG